MGNYRFIQEEQKKLVITMLDTRGRFWYETKGSIAVFRTTLIRPCAMLNVRTLNTRRYNRNDDNHYCSDDTEIVCTYMRRERRETTNRVDDSTVSTTSISDLKFRARESVPQPSCSERYKRVPARQRK